MNSAHWSELVVIENILDRETDGLSCEMFLAIK